MGTPQYETPTPALPTGPQLQPQGKAITPVQPPGNTFDLLGAALRRFAGSQQGQSVLNFFNPQKQNDAAQAAMGKAGQIAPRVVSGLRELTGDAARATGQGLARGAQAIPAVGAVSAIAQGANLAINEPEKIGQAIQERKYDIGPAVTRALQIPGNINKPITADEAKVSQMATPKTQAVQPAPSAAPGEEYSGLGTPQYETGPTKVLQEGTEAPAWLKFKRAIGEPLSAVGDILNEPILQTTGRLIGTLIHAQKQAEVGIVSETDLERKRRMMTGGEKPGPDSNWSEVDWAKAFDEGRETYETDVPVWAQVAISLSSLDPLAWFGGAAKSTRFIKNATEAVQSTLIASSKTDDAIMALAKSGEIFQSQPLTRIGRKIPVVKDIIRRTPETNSTLLMQSTVQNLSHYLSAGQSPAEWTEIMGIMAKRALKDPSWVDDAAKFPALAKRFASADDAVRLGKLGVKAGDVISPLESTAGQLTSQVVKSVMAKGGGKTRIGSLVETIANGMAKGAAPEAVQAAKKADLSLLKLLTQTTDELMGVTKEASALRTTQKVLSEYQGFFARYMQLNSVGFFVRNATSSVTQGLEDGVLGIVPRGFYEKTWGGTLGPPVAVRRGTGQAIGEQGGASAGFLAKKLGKAGEVTGKVIDAPAALAKKGEDYFARMAHYKGVDWLFKNTIRSPRVKVIPEQLANAVSSAVSPEAANLLESAAKSAWKPADIDEAVKLIAGGEAWRVPPPEFADFVANQPEVARILQTAADPASFRQAMREWETAKVQDLAGYRPTLPPNDVFDQALRRQLEAEGFTGKRLEDAFRQEVEFLQKVRVPKELSESWAKQAIANLPTKELQVQWMAKFQEAKLLQNQKYQELAGTVAGIRRRALEDGVDWYGETAALWKKAFDEEKELWHAFREQAEALLPEQAKIAGDVARNVADNMAPTEKAAEQISEQLPVTQAGAPPDPAMTKAFSLPSEVRDARRLRLQVEKNWGNKFENLNEAQLQAVRSAADAAKTRIIEARQVADQFGTFLRDATYYNYADRRNFDTVLRMAYSYPYWYTREMASTVRRLIQNPHMIYAMNNLRGKLEEQNQNLPEWMRDNFTFTTDGGLMSFPILNNIDPANFMYRQSFTDPEMAQDPFGRAYMAMNEFGPGSTHMALGHVLGVLASVSGKPDLAYSYAQQFGLTSKLIYDLTGWAPESLVAGLPYSPYAQTMVQGPQGPMFVGFKYDRNGLVKALDAMVAGGKLSPEKYEEVLNVVNDPYNRKYASDPAYTEAWSIYQQALESKRQADLPRTLISWFGGPAGRYYTESDVDIMNSQMAYGQLISTLREQGASDEQWKQEMAKFWSDPEHANYDRYVMGKKRGRDADEAYAWSVLSRLPPGRSQYDILENAGVSQELLDAFYSGKGLPADWTKQDYDEFMRGVASIGAAIAMPDAPTLDEWKIARDRRGQLQDAMENQFGAEAVESYMDWQAGGYDKTFAERNPVVQEIDNFRASYIMADEVGGKKILAAYYASSATLETFLRSQFREENFTPTIGVWQELKAQAALGDPAAESALKRYERQNRGAIDAYRQAEKKFKKELEDNVDMMAEGLPDVRLPEVRTDVQAQSSFTGAVAGGLQAEPVMPVSETSQTGGAVSQADSLIDQERERLANDPSFLTSDSRLNYSDILSDEIFSQVNYDPEAAMDRFYATHPQGWQVYPAFDTPQELMRYMGDARMLREAILTDTGNKWTQVLAYIRTLPPEELARLRTRIPDIEWVAAHSGRWDDGPSEAARADVVGVNVSFNHDGTISISRMSEKEYFGGKSQPGEQFGGFSYPGMGGAGTGKTDYYTPRKKRGRRGGGGGGGDYETPVQAGGGEDWATIQQQFSSRPDFLTILGDFLALSEYEGQGLLSRYPELALYISQLSPDRLAAMRRAYLSWAMATGRLSTSQARRQKASGVDFGPALRVYSRRSGRSGL